MIKTKVNKTGSVPAEKMKEYDGVLYESEQLKEEMKVLAPDSPRYKEIMQERKALRSQLDAITGEDKTDKKNPPNKTEKNAAFVLCGILQVAYNVAIFLLKKSLNFRLVSMVSMILNPRYRTIVSCDSVTQNNKSNRLQKVSDPSGDMPGMADYVERPGTYNYDANGNMTYDPGKGGNIKYNYLNLPAEVKISDTRKIFYHYDAAGNKLAKYVSDGNTYKTTEYIANLVYTDKEISFFSTEEGRAIPIESNGTTRWHYEYNLKDHLGNTRVTFGGSSLGGAADIVQTSSYYPFGMIMAQENFNSGGNSYQLNKYLYNGKELQDDVLGEISLDWYDYGARFYDPSLGRFMVQDKYAEVYYPFSPYSYCAGNPIKNVDVNGEFIGTIIGTVVGAAAGAYDSYQSSGGNWNAVKAGAAEGAVSGFIAGAAVDLVVAATVATGGGALVVIGAGAAAGAAGGAIGAAAGDATGQVVTSMTEGTGFTEAVSNISTENMGDKMTTGAITGAIGGAAGGAVGKGLQVAKNSTKAVQSTMSKNITQTATTLTEMGADSKTVGTAMNKITTGMGKAGANTVNTSNKVAAGVGMTTESVIKVKQLEED